MNSFLVQIKSNLKTTGYHHNIHATIAPVDICSLPGGYGDIQSPLLSKFTDESFPSNLYITF